LLKVAIKNLPDHHVGWTTRSGIRLWRNFDEYYTRFNDELKRQTGSKEGLKWDLFNEDINEGEIEYIVCFLLERAQKMTREGSPSWSNEKPVCRRKHRSKKESKKS